jgi:hypothetical protein
MEDSSVFGWVHDLARKHSFFFGLDLIVIEKSLEVIKGIAVYFGMGCI